MGRLSEYKKQRDAKKNKEEQRFLDEIDTLERRTRQYRNIDLGDGSTISVLERLPESLEEEFRRFREKWGEAQQKEQDGNLPSEEKQKLNYELYEWLALLCENPLLTADYFNENKDRWASEDLLRLLFAYYDGITERVDKQVQRIENREVVKKFRSQ